MKTHLKLILVLMLSLITMHSQAGGEEKSGMTQQELAIQKMWKQLNRSIRLEPVFRTPGMDVLVEARFQVKTDGSIDVLEITGAEADLSASIERQLESLQLTEPFWLADQSYIVPIRLRYRN